MVILSFQLLHRQTMTDAERGKWSCPPPPRLRNLGRFSLKITMFLLFLLRCPSPNASSASISAAKLHIPFQLLNKYFIINPSFINSHRCWATFKTSSFWRFWATSSARRGPTAAGCPCCQIGLGRWRHWRVSRVRIGCRSPETRYLEETEVEITNLVCSRERDL